MSDNIVQLNTELIHSELKDLVIRFINNWTISRFYDTMNSSKDGGVVSWAGKRVSSRSL